MQAVDMVAGAGLLAIGALVLSSACSVAGQGSAPAETRESTTGGSRYEDGHQHGCTTKHLALEPAFASAVAATADDDATTNKRGARLRSVRPMGRLTRDAVANGPLAEVVAEKGREIRKKLQLPPSATDAECAIEQKRWMRRSALGFPRTASDYECEQEERKRVAAFEKALTPRQLIAFAGTPSEQEKVRIALRSCC
jgi:hypothetical protein